jgi:exosortase
MEVATTNNNQTTTSPGNYALLALLGILIALLFGDTIVQTFKICMNDDDYSHGTLLPFISAYLIWDRREEFKILLARGVAPLRTPKLAVLLLLGGVFIFLLGQISDLLWVRWVALFVTATAVLYMVTDFRVARFLTPPLLLLFMAKPLPDSMVPKLFFPLQVFAAKVSARLLEALDVPVYLIGNIIEIPGMKLMVEEACSGLRSMMAILTVAVIIAFSIPLSAIARMFLFLSAVALAIILNIFRVAATGVLAHFYDPSAASGFFHSFSGLVVFFVGLVVLYYLSSLLKRIGVPK